jgi:hypothetical protein
MNLVVYLITQKPYLFYDPLITLTWILSIFVASVVANKIKEFQHVVTTIIIVVMLIFEISNVSVIYYNRKELEFKEDSEY